MNYYVYNGQFVSESELYHWGVKGMKWGIRRYQNYDGSYTKAGLKRYNAAMDSYDKRLSEYKTAKTSGATGDALRLKKAKVKEAKRNVKKHYKHLKQTSSETRVKFCTQKADGLRIMVKLPKPFLQ